MRKLRHIEDKYIAQYHGTLLNLDILTYEMGIKISQSTELWKLGRYNLWDSISQGVNLYAIFLHTPSHLVTLFCLGSFIRGTLKIEPEIKETKFLTLIVRPCSGYLPLFICQEFWGLSCFGDPSVTWALMEGWLLPAPVEKRGGWMFHLSTTWQPAGGHAT